MGNVYKCLTYCGLSWLALVTCRSAINNLQRLIIWINPGNGGTRAWFYVENGAGECASPLYGANGALGANDRLRLVNCCE